eukprot:UN27431
MLLVQIIVQLFHLFIDFSNCVFKLLLISFLFKFVLQQVFWDALMPLFLSKSTLTLVPLESYSIKRRHWPEIILADVFEAKHLVTVIYSL